MTLHKRGFDRKTVDLKKYTDITEILVDTVDTSIVSDRGRTNKCISKMNYFFILLNQNEFLFLEHRYRGTSCRNKIKRIKINEKVLFYHTIAA